MTGQLTIEDKRLAPIAEKVQAGERLTFEGGLALYRTHDLLALGWLANFVRERMHGNVCYYNVNRHINPTNVCVAHCRLCAFGRDPNVPGAYTMALEEVFRTAASGITEAVTEFHIVGGLHPDLTFDYYLDLIRGLKQRFPQVHLKAFTMVEIGYFAKITKLPAREVLLKLKQAGLDSLPGGGAEIFHPRVRKVICDHKTSGQLWLQIARTAHELGLHSNATMLYGHIESIEDRVRHMIKLREHQDESLASRAAHFNCVVPLSFIPDDSDLSHLPGPTGLDDLRTLALARLMCDNIPHIKAFWIMQTPKLAQVSLNWGVDDLDGTVVWYDITKREGHGTHQELSVDKIKRLIIEAGYDPTERDTLYRPIHRHQP